jgi:hypothetical protein
MSADLGFQEEREGRSLKEVSFDEVLEKTWWPKTPRKWWVDMLSMLVRKLGGGGARGIGHMKEIELACWRMRMMGKRVEGCKWCRAVHKIWGHNEAEEKTNDADKTKTNGGGGGGWMRMSRKFMYEPNWTWKYGEATAAGRVRRRHWLLPSENFYMHFPFKKSPRVSNHVQIL